MDELKSGTLYQFGFSYRGGVGYDPAFILSDEEDNVKNQRLLLLGAGADGKEPLIFRRGSIPYRAFLEGRVENKRYTLLLHLSNMELKRRVADRKGK